MREPEVGTLGNCSRVLAGALPGIWLGMLIGVSFLATPVKFQATGLDLAVALEVGHVTFRTFGRIEVVLALTLALATIGAWRPSWQQSISLLLLVIVALQALWLLPALNARVMQVVSGTLPAPSFHHHAYAIFELTKGVMLLGLTVATARTAVAPRDKSNWPAA